MPRATEANGKSVTSSQGEVVLVLDDLNTRSVASPYAAFAPAEAKRLADRLEIHHTPEHGNWLTLRLRSGPPSAS